MTVKQVLQAPVQSGDDPPVPTAVELAESVRRGITDAQAGRSVSGEEAMREFRVRADQIRERLNRDGTAGC